jgi:hypothetical protein
MKTFAPSLLILILSAGIGSAQSAGGNPPPAPASTNSASAPAASPAATGIAPPTALTANSTPLELARAALAAQGGDSFKNLKNMWLTGSVDLYAPNSAQALPGKFSLITAGERMRLDVDARPVFSFKQIYDGQQSYSSMPGVQMPPANKFGLPVLARYDQPGYTVSAIPDKKKLRGFRIADPEGNSTDFYIDATTGRVMQYLIPFNGYTFGIENSKFKEFEGVLVPTSFSQRMEMPQGAFFAEYKVKDVKLNQALGDDVFKIE